MLGSLNSDAFKMKCLKILRVKTMFITFKLTSLLHRKSSFFFRSFLFLVYSVLSGVCACHTHEISICYVLIANNVHTIVTYILYV